MLRGIYDHTRKKRSRNILLFIIVPLVFSISGIVILWWLASRAPFLIYVGVISFALAACACFVCCVFLALRTSLYVRKRHYGLWKKGFSFSYKQRAEASRQIALLDDPYLKTISLKWNRIGMFWFFLWLVFFVVGVVIVLSKNSAA